jgi:hypothetical protein
MNMLSSLKTVNRATGVTDREAGLRTRFLYWLAKRRYGRVPLAMRLRARDPKLLRLARAMDLHIAAEGLVAFKLKELVQIKVAMLVGCPG